MGDHSAETFEPLWDIVSKWKCYFYITRTLMRPSRLTTEPGGQAPACDIAHAMANRHMSIARLKRKSLCYSKSETMLKHSIRLLIHYLKFWDVPVPYTEKCFPS